MLLPCTSCARLSSSSFHIARELSSATDAIWIIAPNRQFACARISSETTTHDITLFWSFNKMTSPVATLPAATTAATSTVSDCTDFAETSCLTALRWLLGASAFYTPNQCEHFQLFRHFCRHDCDFDIDTVTMDDFAMYVHRPTSTRSSLEGPLRYTATFSPYTVDALAHSGIPSNDPVPTTRQALSAVCKLRKATGLQEKLEMFCNQCASQNDSIISPLCARMTRV